MTASQRERTKQRATERRHVLRPQRHEEQLQEERGRNQIEQEEQRAPQVSQTVTDSES